MCDNNHFKAFILCSCDVAADVDHLLVKRIHLEYLVGYLYIVREDVMKGGLYRGQGSVPPP
jgi:hypothetical protein